MKCRVFIPEQYKDFSDQDEARKNAIATLQSGIVNFIQITNVEVKEEAA